MNEEMTGLPLAESMALKIAALTAENNRLTKERNALLAAADLLLAEGHSPATYEHAVEHLRLARASCTDASGTEG